MELYSEIHIYIPNKLESFGFIVECFALYCVFYCVLRVRPVAVRPVSRTVSQSFNPLRPNNDLSQTSHCNIKSYQLVRS